MEYDRRRAAGRWAELVGPAGVGQDMLMRRFGLYSSSREDYARLRGHTREIFDAYARGVNAFVAQAAALPTEFGLLGLTPEPWQPWDGMAVYKVRHVMMGVWEGKLWRAKLLNRLGPAILKALHPTERQGDLLVLPPGAGFEGAVEIAAAELLEAAGAVAWMKDEQGGSNNWWSMAAARNPESRYWQATRTAPLTCQTCTIRTTWPGASPTRRPTRRTSLWSASTATATCFGISGTKPRSGGSAWRCGAPNRWSSTG